MPTRDQLYNRAYSRAYFRLRPLVAVASRLTSKAVRKGELPVPIYCVCVDCGQPAAVYDHRDYTKPLDVQPVCLSCNHKRGPGHPYIGAAKIVPDEIDFDPAAREVA